MCGIFAVQSSNNHVGSQILDGLKQLEYRGYDSWGIVLNQPKKAWTFKKLGKLKNAKLPTPPVARIGLGHTRWATHGGVTLDNTHPHSDCTGRFFVVHNGIIENYEELKKSLQAKHHHFKSDTDTEVAAHLMEELSRSLQPEKAFVKLTLLLEGSNAVVILDNSTQELYAFKSSSPLVIGKTLTTSYLSSDMPTLSQQTTHVYPLNDDEAVKLIGKKWTFLDGKPIQWASTKNMQSLPSVHRSLITTPHHMLSEILEQPIVWQQILDNQHQLRSLPKSLFLNHKSVVIIGCGTAGYAGQVLAQLLSSHLLVPVHTLIASEVAANNHLLHSNTLVMALSQSGETLDTLNAVKLAKSNGATIISFTNVGLSSLARISDHSLDILAGPEVAVCATKSFTAKLVWSLLLSAYLSQSKKRIDKDMYLAINAAKQLLKPASLKSMQELTLRLASRHHAFVLGRGLYVPLVYETALKAKEVSYLHYEAFAAGELKHGVIALIEPGTPVILHTPDGESYISQLTSAQEVAARGALVIGIGSTPNSVFDHFIPVPDCGQATILLHAVVGQLIGYYLALARNLDPDMPRNLAKSVTVA